MTAKATTDTAITWSRNSEPLTDHPAALGYVVRVLASPDERDRGRVALVKDSGLALARGPTEAPALSLVSRGVSRKFHGRIRWCPMRGAFMLENLGGSGGTFLNGFQLARRLLADADSGGPLAEPRDERDPAATAHASLATARERLVDGDVLRLGDVVLRFSAVAKGSQEQQEPWQAPEINGLSLRGRSPRLRELLRTLKERAKNLEPTLLRGPTGCGKDVLAHYMHKVSGLRGEFVTVNCPGSTDNTFPANVFGTEPDRFTGVSGGPGLLEAAKDGTLFLDEIGDLSPANQARVLQPFSKTGGDASLGKIEFRREGSARLQSVRALLVAATCVGLESLRGDLRRRLGGDGIEVPPLRDRPEDIEPIVLGSTLRDLPLSASLWEALMLHDWPTNVGGLFTALRLARDQAEQGDGHPNRPNAPPEKIGLRDLGASDRQRIREARDERMWCQLGQLDTWVRAGEHHPTAREVEWLRQHFAGNVTQAAAHCGFDRAMLLRWIKRYGHYSEKPKPHWSGPPGAPPVGGP